MAFQRKKYAPYVRIELWYGVQRKSIRAARLVFLGLGIT